MPLEVGGRSSTLKRPATADSGNVAMMAAPTVQSRRPRDPPIRYSAARAELGSAAALIDHVIGAVIAARQYSLGVGEIDTGFDFRSDTPPGKDPDRFSQTLRRYHQLLWSRPLPSGKAFDLSTTTPGVYLHHRSELGEFFLGSDAVITTFARRVAMQPIISQVPEEEREAFLKIGYSIGGMIVWPGNRIDGTPTMNVARGFNRSIGDRFDLTLEAIRRHYEGGSSPLGGTIARYADFFGLFANFEEYVDYFLLNDLVDGRKVKFFSSSFRDFGDSPFPGDMDEYREFRSNNVAFINARNERIAATGL